ncbi:MAG: aminotransferase class I/II-fold pyridoxal phosphate-dependent enzyme [Deinococcales bacterium]
MSNSYLSPQVAHYISQVSASYEAMSSNALETELYQRLAAHEQAFDHESIVLYAGTNILNPKVRAVLGTSLASRASLGHPGAKYNKGMEEAEKLEVMTNHLLQHIFKADYAESRIPSGSLANLYAYMATCKAGDDIMVFHEGFAGHVSHHQAGAAGLYGLKSHIIPCDREQMDIDVDPFVKKAREIRPKLFVVAGSMCLYPYNLGIVREMADEMGAYVLYDAAHMGGLIAGGHFQDPLREGAHLMGGSTYKSLGGPPAGILLTNDSQLAEKLDRIAFPGMTANFDMARHVALSLALLDILDYGPSYAAQMIANAKALAEALAAEGVKVFSCAKGYTSSQHLAIEAHAYGGGDKTSAHLAKANIIASGIGLPLAPMPKETQDSYNGIRLGTQEITRWGMKEQDMTVIAQLMGRILVKGETPEKLKPEVIAFRQSFQNLSFMRV